MADPSSLVTGHGRHDPLLVAAAASRGTGPVPTLAQALLAACTECARLHRDLLAIATALPATATPRRTHEYALTAADAARIRPRGLRRWIRLLGSPRDAVTRPLALGFTTLGLAGLLVAGVPAITATGMGGGPSASVAPDVTPEVMPMAIPSADGFQQLGPTGGGAAPRPSVDTRTETDGAPLPFVLLSGAFTAFGGGLFVARRVGRRQAMR